MTAQAQFAAEQSDVGEFVRQDDAFRDWISAEGSTPYPAAANRYHLYVSLACPWASRTVIARHLRGLELVIGLTVADPVRYERGWAFHDGPGYSADPINGFDFLQQAYVATDANFYGRATVPVLWDKQTHRIVNNSEDDICRMFNDAFAAFGAPVSDLFPADLASEQAELSSHIYERINNGGYLKDLYQPPGIAETVNIDHIKRHYYMTHDAINPTRIVPLGPILDLTTPHGRERLSS